MSIIVGSCLVDVSVAFVELIDVFFCLSAKKKIVICKFNGYLESRATHHKLIRRPVVQNANPYPCSRKILKKFDEVHNFYSGDRCTKHWIKLSTG